MFISACLGISGIISTLCLLRYELRPFTLAGFTPVHARCLDLRSYILRGGQDWNVRDALRNTPAKSYTLLSVLSCLFPRVAHSGNRGSYVSHSH